MGWTQTEIVRIIRVEMVYDDSGDHAGPACYELGTGGPKGGGIHYRHICCGDKKRNVGESLVMLEMAHSSDIIDKHLRAGWHLYYRACACSSKEAIEQRQDNLLGRSDYDLEHNA